jgi:hypothetical protein
MAEPAAIQRRGQIRTDGCWTQPWMSVTRPPGFRSYESDSTPRWPRPIGRLGCLSDPQVRSRRAFFPSEAAQSRLVRAHNGPSVGAAEYPPNAPAIRGQQAAIAQAAGEARLIDPTVIRPLMLFPSWLMPDFWQTPTGSMGVGRNQSRLSLAARQKLDTSPPSSRADHTRNRARVRFRSLTRPIDLDLRDR